MATEVEGSVILISGLGLGECLEQERKILLSTLSPHISVVTVSNDAKGITIITKSALWLLVFFSTVELYNFTLDNWKEKSSSNLLWENTKLLLSLFTFFRIGNAGKSEINSSHIMGFSNYIFDLPSNLKLMLSSYLLVYTYNYSLTLKVQFTGAYLLIFSTFATIWLPIGKSLYCYCLYYITIQ